MKIQTKILILFSLFVFFVCGLTYDIYYIAPKRFTIRYESVSSTRIPKSLNDVNLLFFSDLHFGLFMNIERLSMLIKTINNSGADIVIFGGDLLNLENNDLDESTVDQLINLLNSINAPLGKFAVYGDYDYRYLNLVNEILDKSNFEILNNRNIQIRNKKSQAINLIGLDNEINGNLDIANAYENIIRTAYTITICHTPDTVIKLPPESSDLYLTGHSLGGQAFFIFDSLYNPEKTDYYFRGKHNYEDSILIDITGGTGTLIKDIRFLSNAEVVVYRLKHLEVVEAQ